MDFLKKSVTWNEPALKTDRHEVNHARPLSLRQARLSTDDLDERDRLGLWRDVYSKHLFNLDIEQIGDGPFRADVALRALPGANIALGTRSPSRTSITAPLLHKASDTLVLAVTTRGRSHAQQLGRAEDILAGGAILLSAAELASHTLEDDGELLSISVSKASLQPYVSDINSAIMRPFNPGTDALHLLVGYARGAMALGDSASPQLQGMVGLHLRDLMAALLGARSDAQEFLAKRGVRVARLQAIKAEITAQLDRADLSAETVARRLRISGSYVRKLLQAEGLSFSEYVLDLRLHSTFTMLRDPRLAESQISAIALSAGFSDISYFNRCFRRRFGMTPSEAKGSI